MQLYLLFRLNFYFVRPFVSLYYLQTISSKLDCGLTFTTWVSLTSTEIEGRFSFFLIGIQRRFRGRISKLQPLVRMQAQNNTSLVSPFKSICPAILSFLSTMYLISTCNNISKWYVHPKHEALYPPRLLRALIQIVTQRCVQQPLRASRYRRPFWFISLSNWHFALSRCFCFS